MSVLQPRLMTARQAAAHLGVSLETLRQIERRGYIQSFSTPGGHRRYNHRMLDEYLEKSTGFFYKGAVSSGKGLDTRPRSEG